MFLVVGAVFALGCLMTVAASLLRAAARPEPTPDADEAEEPDRKAA